MHDRPGRILLGYDVRILRSALAATFARWHDRILALAALGLALVGLRHWISGFTQPVAMAVMAAVGLAAGLAAGRLIAARLAYHQYDGPLTAEALTAGVRTRYLLGWHAPAAGIVAALTLVAWPALLAASLPGYAVGAGLAFGFAAAPASGLATSSVLRLLRTLARDPRAGVGAAGVLIMALLAFGPRSDPAAQPAIAGIVAALLALPLTALDPPRIRFLLQSGHAPGRMIARQGRGLSWFAGLATPAAFLFGWQAAAAVALVSALALLLMAIRLLAYALHRKRAAELLITALIGLLAFVGYAMPFLLPPVAALLLWRLHRQAVANRWMLP